MDFFELKGENGYIRISLVRVFSSQSLSQRTLRTNTNRFNV